MSLSSWTRWGRPIFLCAFAIQFDTVKQFGVFGQLQPLRRSNFKLLTTGPICHASRQCSALLRFQAKPISAGRHGHEPTRGRPECF